jgi:hypothetical protein
VLEAGGRVNPCFFIQGPLALAAHTDLAQALNDQAMAQLRTQIRAGRRAECTTCVCSMWRDPENTSAVAVGAGAASADRHRSALRYAALDH